MYLSALEIFEKKMNEIKNFFRKKESLKTFELVSENIPVSISSFCIEQCKTSKRYYTFERQ